MAGADRDMIIHHFSSQAYMNWQKLRFFWSLFWRIDYECNGYLRGNDNLTGSLSNFNNDGNGNEMVLKTI